MRIIIPIVLLCLLSNCRREDKIPAGIFSREKMEAVMWDMMQADQFVAGYIMHSDTGLNRTVESAKLYQQVFAIHKINLDELSRSIDYYRSHPALLRDIMDSLSRAKTIAPTKPVLTPADTVAAGEERLVQPTTDTQPKGRRKPQPVPVN